MNIKQLKYFLGVLKDRSITRASSRLFIAQPALGLQIRKLEEEFNVELFVRHSRGVDPTEAGLRLAAHAENIIGQVERARQDMFEYAGEPQGVVSVGLTGGTCALMSAEMVKLCRQEYPSVSLCITDALSEQLTEWVLDGRLDLTLTYNPDTSPGLVTEPLVTETLCFVQNSNNVVLKKSDASFAKILQTELTLQNSSHHLRALLNNAALKMELQFEIKVEVNSVPAIKQLIHENLATSILPMSTVLHEVKNGEFTAWPLKEPTLQRTLYIAHSSGRYPESKAFRGVISIMRRVVRNLAENNDVCWSAYVHH